VKRESSKRGWVAVPPLHPDDCTSPRPSKRPTFPDVSSAANRSPRIGVLFTGSVRASMHSAPHRARLTIAASVETPDVPQICQSAERVSHEEEAVEKCSSRWIAMLTHVSSGPSGQIHDRRAHRNAQRAADSSKCGTAFRAREDPQASVLDDGSRCVGTYTVAHRSRFTNTAPVETPSVP
jgi:hypothetical protein